MLDRSMSLDQHPTEREGHALELRREQVEVVGGERRQQAVAHEHGLMDGHSHSCRSGQEHAPSPNHPRPRPSADDADTLTIVEHFSKAEVRCLVPYDLQMEGGVSTSLTDRSSAVAAIFRTASGAS